MVNSQAFLSCWLAAILGLSKAATLQQRNVSDSETTPTAFDGQYLTNPAPGPSNSGTEWWWFQAIGEEVDGIIPSIEAIFYEGFAFTRALTQPNWRFDVSGVWPNGTTFFISTPLTTAPEIMTRGQAVVGNWGSLGSFALSGDRSRLIIDFNVKEQNELIGSIIFLNKGTQAHGPCNASISTPYYSSLSTGKSLNADETILYEQTGWAITMPRAKALVNVNVNGTPFVLTNTVAYHDHNWAPKPINEFAYTWLTGEGSCGPFDLAYLEVQAIGSSRSNDILQGTLAYHGSFLQNQCSLYGEGRTDDTVNITLTGQTTDAVTGEQVPTGVVLDFTLRNGTHFIFNLTYSIENPAQIPYHRWRAGGSGGRVGGPQYKCLLIVDWLNPGLTTYKEGGKNIFEQQAQSSTS